MFTETYTIQSLLFDMTGGHFRSYFLCKKGFHNYQLQSEVKITPITESYKNPFITITRYEREYTLIWKCVCCGKEKQPPNWITLNYQEPNASYHQSGIQL